MSTVAAIAFTPAPASDSPNLRSANDDSLRTFHGLIDLCFSSLRRWNPELTVVLVTTTSPGEEMERRLAELDARVLLTQFNHQPPAGFFHSFNASLFSIDALACLAAAYPAAEDRILLLDPDVICTGSLKPVAEAIPTDGFLAYDTEYDLDYVCQGLSAVTAGELHRQLDLAHTQAPRHYGGELYGFTSSTWDAIAPRVEEAWQFSLDQWTKNLPRFVTEEQLMNFALRYTRVEQASPYIRRIWTAPTHRTVLPGDLTLPLWHLPAEKHRGLARMLPASRDPQSWFWGSEHPAWRDTAAAHFGIPRRDPKRLLWDLTGAAVRRTQALVSTRGAAQ
ncbi:hypothetical protein GCM10022223_05820 [Kineosporia mesophila]|uniref:Glycosyl transferase family 8 n=1 Tax=Kineosporia mesophila TaxID=566012 RepID=A0ABP6YZK4_9ACTN|nr:hypothetical protein [Kineosporia mesophila]MCD5350966.1 hypothetical protein [Kineosporia mesophila]